MMNLTEYQKLAMRTSPEGHDRVLNGCMGLVGEAGEVVDLVKKWKFQSVKGTELPREKLVGEIGDICWYCAELTEGLKERLQAVYDRYARMVNEKINLDDGRPELAAFELAQACAAPANLRYFEGGDEIQWALKAGTERQVTVILLMCDRFLRRWCGSRLEEAMEGNIGKLRARYPDGFDAKKSMERYE